MSSEHEKFMAMAIEEARKGLRSGEPPFGAVIVRDGQVIGRAYNTVNSSGDPTAHAETMSDSGVRPFNLDLLAVKTGERKLTPEREVPDLKVSDYLVEVDASDNISYQYALIVAMKKERAAFELYSDMAEKVSDTNLKQVFVGLAKEEAKHKLFFETEYEERVLMHN